jgi:hypothetical protein
MKKSEAARYENELRRRWEPMRDTLDERQRRIWAAAEAGWLPYGGIAIVMRVTGIARSTIKRGTEELMAGGTHADLVKVRRRGGGRKRIEESCPQIVEALEKLVGPTTRGDPESALLWTCKSTRILASELSERCGRSVSHNCARRLLIDRGFSLQAVCKTEEGKRHPDRNAQFEFIDAKANEFISSGTPVVSVDTKKKEHVGNFKNAGREWHGKGGPELADIHDFPHRALAKVTPYGVYDIAANNGFVNVGISHDTAAFAVASIEMWWNLIGSKRYPHATSILITADAGGSNGYRIRLWKSELQRFADKYRLSVHVSHYPPGTSKWNRIEHRLFSFISLNWRGRPLRTLETVVNLIGHTTTKAGLIVTAQMDVGNYPLGVRISDETMRELHLEPDDFHGEWNYTLRPRHETATPSVYL